MVGYRPSTTSWAQEKDLERELVNLTELRKGFVPKLQTFSKKLKLELAVLESKLVDVREQALTFKDVFRLG